MDYIQKCLEKFGDTYQIYKYEKKFGRIKIYYNCKVHGDREQTFNSLIKNGCYKCYKTLSIESFIENSNIKHNNFYDYSKSKYLTSKTDIEIICPKHGSFWQKPNCHLSGSGCFYCTKDIKTTEDFIKKSNHIFNNKYNYSLSIYIGKSRKIKIICPTHGIFEQLPSTHLSGSGCRKCTYNLFTLQEFIKKCREIHGNLFDYSKVIYINSQSKVEIICQRHGSFWQKPGNHKNKKYGCPKCFDKTSKMEIEWLNNMGIKEEYRQYKIGSYIVDGFDPITNTIYEFYGDYWHGNPNKYKLDDINESCNKKFEELYNNTISREIDIINMGYNIISMWEFDYKDLSKKLIK